MKFLSRKELLNIICLFGFCSCCFGQATSITGEVVDEGSKEPLIGASILVKGSSQGTVTDFDGKFVLNTDLALPFVVVVSYTGFSPKEMEISASISDLKIELTESAIVTNVVEVTGQRISDKQKSAPLTIESLDLLAIKETASDNFYDGLGTLKGVDLTAASLGFKVINTRGFNSTSPVRSLQIIDGVDNQAPGLNFSLGNFLGSPELDVLKVDIVQGASSAFYGPNAFNGVISMETKNPFLHQGLSASAKVGERSLFEGAARWAQAVKNKEGNEFFAYKINFAYLRANDWEAENYDPITDSRVTADNPGRFDAVNIYGDEYFSGNDISSQNPWPYPGLDIFYRTGYQEIDLVDYDTRNLKANAAFHFRTKPSVGIESPEFIASTNYGTGTTVYQGDNRFSLRNIRFYQNRLEFRKRGKYFIRAYASHENAGDSYDPYFTALAMLDSAKTNLQWSQDYFNYWVRNINPQIISDEDFPVPTFTVDPETGEVIIDIDTEGQLQWLADNNDQVVAWHAETEAAANMQNNPLNSEDFFVPGTARFDSLFNLITGKERTEGGTRFFTTSALYHAHGEYIFTPGWTDQITVGANGRLYAPNSRGSIFRDTFDRITNFEFGLYGGISKSVFDEKLNLQFTLRADKNQNFNWLFSPAASIVWKPAQNNYLRASFSSAIRNPTLQDQYLFLNVGPAILAGNLNGVTDFLLLDDLNEWLATNDPAILERKVDIDPVRPERVRTLEFGYRTTLFQKLYVDAGFYYNWYTDFLGFFIGADVETDDFGRPRKVQVFRYAANSTSQVQSQGFSIGLSYYFARYFQASGNYSWNRLVTETDDPVVPAFNTPEHKFNLGLSGRDIPIGSPRVTFGFNVNYKWIEGFLFEGSPQFTGFIPTYDLLDAQVNVRVSRINTTFKVGASNVLDQRQFQTYGGPAIGRLAYASVVYDWKK